MTLKGDATFSYPANMPATDLAALTGGGLKNGRGEADLFLPSTLSLGFDWQATPSFSLQGEAARTTWSRFKELRVKFPDNTAPQTTESLTEENWRDTTFLSLGGTWKVNQAWMFRAGVAFDKGAVEDAYRTPRIPDNDRKWVSIGTSYAFSKNVAIDIGFSHLVITDGKVALRAGTAATDPNITRGNLDGTIKAAINILGASLRYSF
jgi:long-chain fatty acid transport protein